MGFRELRKTHPIEEFDYPLLMTYLADYANRRDKATRLLRSNKITRIKKGLYVFGPDYRKGLICKESLANLIYGPSYISFEYALSYYGMIPERVETITSATTGRSRIFHTPIGTFSYKHLPQNRYSIGISWNSLDEYHSIFIASPEKALVDTIYHAKKLDRATAVEDFLFEDLRIEESSLKNLSLERLSKIAFEYQNNKINRVINFISTLKLREPQ